MATNTYKQGDQKGHTDAKAEKEKSDRIGVRENN